MSDPTVEASVPENTNPEAAAPAEAETLETVPAPDAEAVAEAPEQAAAAEPVADVADPEAEEAEQAADAPAEPAAAASEEAADEVAASVEDAGEAAPVEAAQDAASADAPATDAPPADAPPAEAADAAPAADTEKKAEAKPAQQGRGDRRPKGGAQRHEISEKAEDSGGVSEVAPIDVSTLSEEMMALVAAMEGKNAVEGKVIGWNKGGYHVAVGKIAAFCPVSQMEIGNPRSPKKYLDKAFNFHVIEIQQNGRRVVLSRTTVLKNEREAAAAKVRENIKAGAELEGRVSSITDFGAFVDLGSGIEGLVHVSELSRRRVEHAKELLTQGQHVKVSVLKVEKGGKRISLSMKKLEADPWDLLPETLVAGGEFEGKVMRKSEFGLFVEVLPGVEGLIHTSRLPIGAKMEDAAFEVGQSVKGWVQDVEKKRRRLSLSLREIGSANPWKGIAERYPEGQMVKGKVEKLTNFGAFVELEPGLTGLLAFSQLGGPGNPKRQYQIGREVNVRVLSIDRERRRISLGTENSKAEGGMSDYKEYMKQQGGSSTGAAGAGMSALAAAFAKAKSA